MSVPPALKTAPAPTASAANGILGRVPNPPFQLIALDGTVLDQAARHQLDGGPVPQQQRPRPHHHRPLIEPVIPDQYSCSPQIGAASATRLGIRQHLIRIADTTRDALTDAAAQMNHDLCRCPRAGDWPIDPDPDAVTGAVVPDLDALDPATEHHARNRVCRLMYADVVHGKIRHVPHVPLLRKRRQPPVAWRKCHNNG